MAAVRDKTNNQLRVYVDGIFDKQLIDSINASTVLNNDKPFKIGSGFITSDSRTLRGNIDDVRVCNSALSNAQILQVKE